MLKRKEEVDPSSDVKDIVNIIIMKTAHMYVSTKENKQFSGSSRLIEASTAFVADVEERKKENL
ncbi:CLUMA_CG011658, isoform A [Clunio marinus]|uniref:CLUMA_CG011658, isoform A n=1 Tax=Clunio marinus TaxID=568069 RepID=A0A1J1IDK4_9DIPT|nr:CLUMA_CG011658, isoform A [Clunio marinus]